MKTCILIATIAASGILFGAHTANAHCDALDGPVAAAVQRALENGNINPVLAYAPETAETEILAAFEQSRVVRTLGADAQALADRAFMETVVRLHRAGEGAAYTGLKPAGANYGPDPSGGTCNGNRRPQQAQGCNRGSHRSCISGAIRTCTGSSECEPGAPVSG